MKSAAKLILFDIDGTLIDTAGAGLISLEVAFYAAFPERQERLSPPSRTWWGDRERASHVSFRIGDTPKDIACARAFAARVVAVANGAATRADLEVMAPDVLLDDLSDCDGVMKAIASLFSS